MTDHNAYFLRIRWAFGFPTYQVSTKLYTKDNDVIFGDVDDTKKRRIMKQK